MANFKNSLLAEGSNHTPLSDKDLIDISNKYLENYCENANSFDRNIWKLYHGCKNTVFEKIGSSNALSRRSEVGVDTKKIFLNFINKVGIDAFLVQIIDQDTFNGPAPVYRVSDIVTSIYDSWDGFEGMITKVKNNESKYIEEFSLFFAEYKMKGFREYVPFDFDQIDLTSKN